MRQTAEDALNAARQQAVGVKRLAAKVDSMGQARMQVGDERSVVLARGHGGDLDVGMMQEDFDEFERGVTGAAEDGRFNHSRVRDSGG